MFVRCNERLERTVGKSGREVRPSHVLVAKVQKQPRAMGRWEGGSPSRESSAESRGWGEGCTGRQETGSEGSPPPWRLSCSMCLVPVWYSCALRRQRGGTRRAFCPPGMLLVAEPGNPTLGKCSSREGTPAPVLGLASNEARWLAREEGDSGQRRGLASRSHLMAPAGPSVCLFTLTKHKGDSL